MKKKDKERKKREVGEEAKALRVIRSLCDIVSTKGGPSQASQATLPLLEASRDHVDAISGLSLHSSRQGRLSG